MAYYVLLTRMTVEGAKDLSIFEKMNHEVSKRIEEEELEIRWLANYTVLGPYDYLDIFEAPDNEAAAKLALIIRSFGHADTEVWPAVPWERIKEITEHTVKTAKPKKKKEAA